MENLKAELAEVIKKYHNKGWSPATSTNYSFKHEDTIYVSRSGIDKSNFTEDDFIEVDTNGHPTPLYKNIKPSAETLIHCVLYEIFPETKVILHAHSIYDVLNSQTYQDSISFQGYEIQKGFKGQTTHLDKVNIPIFQNSQDMLEFTSWMKARKEELTNFTFLIRNHGAYAWGENLFEAKRHLETLEYLLEVNWKLHH